MNKDNFVKPYSVRSRFLLEYVVSMAAQFVFWLSFPLLQETDVVSICVVMYICYRAAG